MPGEGSMPSQSIPDFESLWDYADPAGSEARFRQLMPQIPESRPVHLELLTQIARAQGLQGNFTGAHQTLDRVETATVDKASVVRVRYLLERGRLLNSSGTPEAARPLFQLALDLARQIGADDYAIDAIHMLANISTPDESLRLNQEAIAMAEASDDERARKWLGSLYNNIGWAYHGLGEYAAALAIFQKAEAWQRSKGRVSETRVAVWCVARTLRSLGQIEEALAKQMALQKELESAGEHDGYVFEEIGECLLALDRAEVARAYFARAYEILSRDRYLNEQEPERLRRLSELAGSGQPSNG